MKHSNNKRLGVGSVEKRLRGVKQDRVVVTTCYDLAHYKLMVLLSRKLGWSSAEIIRLILNSGYAETLAQLAAAERDYRREHPYATQDDIIHAIRTGKLD